MKKTLGVLLFSLISVAEVGVIPGSFPQGARNIVNQVFKQLNACGLQVLNAYDPRLPRPQIIALGAIVATNPSYPNGLQLLAYYTEDSTGEYAFKAPNGGMKHLVTFTDTGVAVQTPYQGRVAWGNRYFDPTGMKFNFWVRGVAGPVPYEVFHQAVQTQFIDVLSNQLCRYGVTNRS